MNLPDEIRDAPVDCWVNGYLRALPLHNAHELLWTGVLGWVLLGDWLRTGIEPRSNKGPAREHNKLYGPVRTFAYRLLTRGGLALCVEDLEDERGDPPTKAAFNAWGSHFGSDFPETRPFERVYFIDPRTGHRRSGYRMMPGQKWCIVVGVSEDSELSDAMIDWTLLESPPGHIDDVNQGHAMRSPRSPRSARPSSANTKSPKAEAGAIEPSAATKSAARE